MTQFAFDPSNGPLTPAEEHRLFDSILRVSIDAVIVYTVVRDEGGEIADFRCVLANPALEKIVGQPATELVGRCLLDFYPNAVEDGLYGKFIEVIETGETSDFEYCSHRRPGARWYRVAAAKLGDGLAISFADITARKQSDRALREAKERAESAERAKGDFLAMISHELRTPMNGVLGFANLLLESPLDETQQEYVRTIERSGRTLLELIDDLLDFSKIEAARLELEDHPFDLRECLHDAAVLIGPLARKKGLSLHEEVAPDVPRHLFGDPTRLRQVVINLLANAVKFTETGRVEIRAMLGGGTGARPLVVEVRDTGIGIDPGVITKLFTPFTQASPATTRRYGGTGLGLAICKSLVELMEGRLEVLSTPGEGSVFRFEIPCRPFFSAPDEIPVPLAAGLRLLVVESEPISRRLLLHFLQQMGHSADAVAEPKAARDAVAGCRYDAALVNVQMPEFDGLACARSLIEADPGLPLVVLASDSDGEALGRAEAVGFIHHLRKPVDAVALERVLGAVLPDGRRSGIA